MSKKCKELFHYTPNRAITNLVNKYGVKQARKLLLKSGCSFTEEELQKFIKESD